MRDSLRAAGCEYASLLAVLLYYSDWHQRLAHNFPKQMEQGSKFSFRVRDDHEAVRSRD